MADWIREMANAEDAPTQLVGFPRDLAIGSRTTAAARAENEEEVPTEPATSPRNIDPTIQEWPVIGVQQPPPPQAQCPDYGRPKEQDWRGANPYVLNYGHLPQEEYERGLSEACRAHLDFQWDHQRREAAEQEWREREAARQAWQDRMVAASFMEVPKVPAAQPPVGIRTETRPRALPEVHQALLANDPKAPSSQPVVQEATRFYRETSSKRVHLRRRASKDWYR